MNTEKLEKLKKSLDNKFIPDNMKDKIRKEIAKLESDIKKEESITASEVKKEVKEIEKEVDKALEVVEDKKEAVAKKTRAKRTPKATPSKTSSPKSATRKKPTRTVMSVAKEIRKEGESWKDAQARARKTMKEDDTKVTKKVESELDKLNKLVKRRKELRGNVGRTDLLRDAKRKALPAGKRISKEGNVYYENRANRMDRGVYGKAYLAKGGGIESKKYEIELFWIGLRGDERKVGKYVVTEKTLEELESQWAHILSIDVVDETNEKPISWFELKKELFSKGREKNLFADGGYLTDPNFGSFQDITYSKGGSVKNERRHVNHDEDYEVRYAKSRPSRTGYKDKRSFDEGGDVKKRQLKKGDDVLIIGRRWFDRVNGNTYHTAEVVVNDKVIGKSRMSYGYEEQYIQTGKEILLDHFELPEGMKESSPLWQLREYGVEFRKRVTDGLKRDLELGGTIVTDLAGHTGGSFGGDPTLLSGVTGTQYSGLVGETGAMSSGEMFANGGAIKNQYEGRTPEDIWDNLSVKQREHFLKDHYLTNTDYKPEDLEQIRETKYLKWDELTGSVHSEFKRHISMGQYARGGSVRNERRHVNHNEDYEVRYARTRPSRTGYKGARKFMAGGMNENNPSIYVADLEAYNNGKLVGEWLDLTDYNDADELNDAIQDLLKEWGVKEYAIHDAENLPSSMYSEYMGAKDFAELYEMMDLAKENDLPLAVVQEIVSQYDTDAVNNFYGKYDSAVDFAQQLVDDTGIQSFTDFERYLIISETDKRLLSQEMADGYVDDIKDEDDGERLIGEADLNLEEYQEADDDTREEMLEKAREIVYDRHYEEWENGLDYPYSFLVEEQGLYDAESFANANFVQIDYDAVADALEYDYTFVSHDGEVYVFDLH